MTEFEAFKAMMVSTLTYMSMTAKDDSYEEGIAESAADFFDSMPKGAHECVVDSFNQIARDDYERVFKKTLNAVIGAWKATLEKYENDKKREEP